MEVGEVVLEELKEAKMMRSDRLKQRRQKYLRSTTLKDIAEIIAKRKDIFDKIMHDTGKFQPEMSDARKRWMKVKNLFTTIRYLQKQEAKKLEQAVSVERV